MEAFITGPGTPFRSRRLIPAQLCPRRSLLRSPPRVRFSATTDEAPPLNGPPTPLQPPRRPDPVKPPEPPVAFAPSRSNPPASPQRSRNGTDGFRPSRDRYSDNLDDGLQRPERFRPSDRGDRGPAQSDFVPDPNLTYYTTCGACKASYEINPEELGPRGRKVACSVCGNEWFQRMDKLSVLDKEKEGMKPYPVGEKEELMQEQSRIRNERRGKRREFERRERGDRRDSREGGRRGRNDRPRDSAHTIFIGNLPFSLEKEELEKIVGEVVQFTRLSLIIDANMRSKGFAFADLLSAEDVQKAIAQLDGKYVNGRAIGVRESRKN
eukprot:GFKZ01013750.1.p1 GENE.GFKZ01013750.1~~GFKZ01013750.1.p1  ORF type:complete len:324 (-),score=51.91 GFKZ01013750.1:671-1642(-)